MNHVVELTAVYKMGLQRFTVPTAIIGRNINRIEQIPPDVPEYGDGAQTRVSIAGEGWVLIVQSYDEVLAAWKPTLESL